MIKYFQADYIGRFSFVDGVANKPFKPWLTRDEIVITAVPSVHEEAVTKTSVVTESARRRLERAVMLRESLSNVSNFLIYIYW